MASRGGPKHLVLPAIHYQAPMAADDSFKRAVLQKCNLTMELRALWDLTEDGMIVVVLADKGSSMVTTGEEDW